MEKIPIFLNDQNIKGKTIKDIKGSTFNLLDQYNVNNMNSDNYIKNVDIMKISVNDIQMLKI